MAQSPIDVPTLVTVAPQEEAPSAGAPRSSFDYEAHMEAAARPWEGPRGPWNAQPGALAAATTAPAPARPTAFTGAAEPLACKQAGRVILDNRSDLKAGTLCVLPDGSWRFLP